MYISEQLLNPNERRLRLATQLRVHHVVPDNRSIERGSAAGGASEWDAAKLAAYPAHAARAPIPVSSSGTGYSNAPPAPPSRNRIGRRVRGDIDVSLASSAVCKSAASMAFSA